ncbi:MAG: bifunctional folylpolyglutamate synthase/dihydrofolate synthase [Chitinophagaceae bacterium]
MNYQESINLLYSKLPMFSRLGASAYKKDLHNTLELCNRLQNPQHKIKTIHIAGTNGKGSVSHMLASILTAAGYKTGLYTSPHLHDFRERIKVNGVMISKEYVIEFTKRTHQWFDEIEPSFFELTVAMAFSYFEEQQVDIAVIETGLGGRLDSTNVIIPELSIITNIGWDHMNILGNTLEKIAFEKAGIIKRNVPVVIGQTQSHSDTLFKSIAVEKNVAIQFADQSNTIKNHQWLNGKLMITVQNISTASQENYTLDLPGIYQLKNVLTALESVNVLKTLGWKINEEHKKSGLSSVVSSTGLHGRWEIIHNEPMVVLDVAHNEDGIKMIKHQLENISFEKLHIIFGMVNDKDSDKVLSLLPKEAQYYFTKANIPRAMDQNELHKKATAYQLQGNSYENINAAIKETMFKAKKEDLILVCGSVFLIGEVDKLQWES